MIISVAERGIYYFAYTIAIGVERIFEIISIKLGLACVPVASRACVSSNSLYLINDYLISYVGHRTQSK